MKNLFLKIITNSFALFITTMVQAQTCESFIMFKKGATYEIETFNAKDKLQNKMAYEVKEVTSTSSGISSTVHTTAYDGKDKLQNELDMKMICNGEKLSIDMTEMFKSMQQKNGGADNMEIIIDGAMIDIPNNMTVGQSLADIATTMKMIDKNSNTEMMHLNMTTSKRKVEGKENITTPAGTFDCFKISYETLVEPKMAMMNMKLPSYLFKGILYFTKDIGMVKTLEFDKDGKDIKSYSMVTKYSANAVK